MIEKMPVGERAEILLKGEEPRRNVPESLIELGHIVETIEPGADGVFRLVVLKK